MSIFVREADVQFSFLMIALSSVDRRYFVLLCVKLSYFCTISPGSSFMDMQEITLIFYSHTSPSLLILVCKKWYHSFIIHPNRDAWFQAALNSFSVLLRSSNKPRW